MVVIICGTDIVRLLRARGFTAPKLSKPGSTMNFRVCEWWRIAGRVLRDCGGCGSWSATEVSDQVQHMGVRMKD